MYAEDKPRVYAVIPVMMLLPILFRFPAVMLKPVHSLTLICGYV